MVVNPIIYDRYWYWAAERQAMFFRKRAGDEPPYTNDPILAEYKFCNAYRDSDRVSQFLIKEVQYSRQFSPRDLLYRTLFFRLLNKAETWTYLEEALSTLTIDAFDVERIASALERKKAAGEAIYGNAFILCATPAFSFQQKHRNHLGLLEYVFFGSDMADRLLAAASLAELFTTLKTLPLIGDFMAYQLAIDLNYSTLYSFDEDDFTVAGPGAKRGIAKCFNDLESRPASEIIQHMVDIQEAEFARLGLAFQSLGTRRLHSIDCQGMFCEIDKYSRVYLPELKSNRVRIKSRYLPSAQPLAYFYPPKWRIAF